MSALGGAVLALYASPITIGIAAFVGMLIGMGRDRGAALVLEQAIIPSTVSDQERTRSFAWYNLLPDVGHGVVVCWRRCLLCCVRLELASCHRSRPW